VLAYRGEVGKGIALASAVTDEVFGRAAPLDVCDVATACVGIYDIVRLFDPAVAQLRGCIQRAKEFGDEPRRAMLSAHLGRFLTYAGHLAEAAEALAEAERLADRLDLPAVRLAHKASYGRWLTDSGGADANAVRVLLDTADAIRSREDVPLFIKVDLAQPDRSPVVVKGRHPSLCRVLLDLNRAARFAGNAEVMDRTLDELDELATGPFSGYCPHFYFAYAECLLAHGTPDQRDLITDLIRSARAAGERSENPWVAQEADRLEHSFEPSGQSAR
jgi:hypothetical protein